MGVTAKIVVRITDGATGKRRWVLTNGKKTDPQGPHYLRYCIGSVPRFQYAADRYDAAFAQKIKLERKLKAAKLGVVIPEEPAAPPPQTRHKISDVLEAYVLQESRPDKNNEERSGKCLDSYRTMVDEFVKWSHATFVDEITRKMLEDYRNHLATVGKGGKPYQPDTIYNKLMTITTVLKNNPLCAIEPPLAVSEFPDKKTTVPDPYTESEFNGFMAHSDYTTALRIYFLAVTGMRDQECAMAEKADINWELGEISVVKKRKFGFRGKTDAALRDIPLPGDLLAELELRPEGLLFPAPHGGVDRHFIRRVEEIAKLAKIKGTTAKPHMRAKGMISKNDWCHRFRDTAITNGLELSCKSMADMLRLIKKIGHANMKTLDSYFGKLAKPYVPSLPERHRRVRK